MWTSRNNRAWLCCALMPLTVFSASLPGCGDDDSAAHDAGKAGLDAGRTNSDAAQLPMRDASSPNASVIGKPCKSVDDCHGAMCATTLAARLGGTAEPARDGYCTMDCTMSSECGAGAACVGSAPGGRGHCAQSCASATDCRNGYRCITALGAVLAADGGTSPISTGACQPVPQTDKLADGVVGMACTAASDCGSGSCMQTIAIVNTSYPGGYCTGRCFGDTDCGATGVCVPGLLGSIGSCYLRCDDQHRCERSGYRCRVVSNVGRCVALADPLPDHVAGNACANDGDCGGGAMSCSVTLGSEPAPGGYCTQSCAINDDCGAGGVCINGIGIVTISSGRCLRACMQASDCRVGYECSPFGGPGSGGPGACTTARSASDAGTL
jgi:hypothetical protein